MTTTTDQEINNLKHRVRALEKTETINKYATYFANAIDRLSSFPPANRLDAITAHLYKLTKEITDINSL
jgi:hypothetical protein